MVEGVCFNHTFLFLKVFAVTAILKVIHALKTPKKDFPHIFFHILAMETSHGSYEYPHIKGYLPKC